MKHSRREVKIMDKKAVQSRVACLISGMSREQLCDFVSTYDRCLSAEQAGRFLQELEWICRDSGGFSAAEPKQSRENLREELEQVQNKLGRIETGELTLDSDYNEECPEAEEWDEVFVFTDPRGLMPLLEQACELVTRCTMAGLYQEAAALTLRLIALKVSVEGEAEDYDLEPFALEDLTDLELLPEGIHVKLLDGLYALYRLEPSEEHIRQMWDVLALRMNGVMLKDVLRGRGEEPEHRKAFLTMWVERLNAETGRRADELLTEALSSLAEGEELYRQIQRVGDKHPRALPLAADSGQLDETDEAVAGCGRGGTACAGREKRRARRGSSAQCKGGAPTGTDSASGRAVAGGFSCPAQSGEPAAIDLPEPGLL